MAHPVLIKAAAMLATDKRTWEVVGVIIATLLSPIILLIMLLIIMSTGIEQGEIDMSELLEGLEISDVDFINPLPYPWRNYVTSEFGYRIDPVTGKRGNKHTGIDIAVPYGTDIYAVADGVVVAVVYGLTDYGYYVKVDHGGGLETMYCHNSANNVNIGDVVKQGDIIGAVGSTGKSTGNHLHFEVRIDGVAVNPKALLP